MLGLLARRAGHAVLVLIVVSLVAFVLSSVIGDPVASILGLQATPADRLALRSRLGLDDPFPVRYLRFLSGVIQGEFGLSYGLQRPVVDLLAERLPATVELAFTALVLSLVIGIPLGVYTAMRRNGRLARFLLSSSIVGMSVPTFVVAILLIFAFAVMLGWLPSFGRGDTVKIGWWSTGLLTVTGLQALILPAFTLAIGQVALVSRLVRAEMLEVLRTDYIRFARARGLTEKSIHFRHALRNTMIPVFTISGIQLGYLVAFAVVAEAVFQWPGLGLLFLQSLERTDVPVLVAYLMFAGVFFSLINLVVDLLYAASDPRIRAETTNG